MQDSYRNCFLNLIYKPSKSLFNLCFIFFVLNKLPRWWKKCLFQRQRFEALKRHFSFFLMNDFKFSIQNLAHSKPISGLPFILFFSLGMFIFIICRWCHQYLFFFIFFFSCHFSCLYIMCVYVYVFVFIAMQTIKFVLFSSFWNNCSNIGFNISTYIRYLNTTKRSKVAYFLVSLGTYETNSCNCTLMASQKIRHATFVLLVKISHKHQKHFSYNFYCWQPKILGASRTKIYNSASNQLNIDSVFLQKF